MRAKDRPAVRTGADALAPFITPDEGTQVCVDAYIWCAIVTQDTASKLVPRSYNVDDPNVSVYKKRHSRNWKRLTIEIVFRSRSRSSSSQLVREYGLYRYNLVFSRPLLLF